MATPDFVVALRAHIGHELLWLSGVTVLVIRNGGTDPEILLVCRADTGVWTPVTGILEPGEQPDAGAIRETYEETRVHIRIRALRGVRTLPPLTYPNGDRCQFLDVCLLAEPVGESSPIVGDEESTDVRWFPLSALPEGSTARTRADLADLRAGTVPSVGLGRFPE